MNVSEPIRIPLPSYQIIVYTFCASVLSLGTWTGNVLVLISVGIEVRLRSISNYYIVSLAIADLLIGCVSMPLYSTFLIMKYWPLGPTVCDLWLSLDYTVSNASVANLLIISYDRYKTITCPLTYRVKRSKRKTVIIIIVAWIISAILWTPLIYIWPIATGGRTIPPDDCYIQFIEASKLMTLATASIAYFIPLIIIMGFSFKIYLVTRRRNKCLLTLGCNIAATISHRNIMKNPRHTNTSSDSQRVKSDAACRPGYNTHSIKKSPPLHPNCIILTPKSLASSTSNTDDNLIKDIDYHRSSQRTKKTNKSKQGSNKAVKTLAAIIIAFFVTWFPYNIFTVVNTFSGRPSPNQPIGSTLYSLGYYLCYINSTINPILYACCNILFRKTFWRIITFGQWSKEKKSFNCMPSSTSSSAAH